jgi:hypothetical protein
MSLCYTTRTLPLVNISLCHSEITAKKSLIYYFLILRYFIPFMFLKYVIKCKAVPKQAQCGPEGSRRFRLPDFHDIRHMKVVRLSASRTDRLYPQEIFLVLIFTRS